MTLMRWRGGSLTAEICQNNLGLTAATALRAETIPGYFITHDVKDRHIEIRKNGKGVTLCLLQTNKQNPAVPGGW